jgi:transcriptional regulator NrdR family protein
MLTCPKCENSKNSVVETRSSPGGLRRRRVCDKCKYKFSTLETTKEFKVGRRVLLVEHNS